jgi:hypothetical protein
MGILRKRYIPKCEACGKNLVQRPREQRPNYLKRKTCDALCQNILRGRNADSGKCFCGKPSQSKELVHCCWDHRLIIAKCKQWGIAVDLDAYEAYSERLQAEQKILDSYY